MMKKDETSPQVPTQTQGESQTKTAGQTYIDSPDLKDILHKELDMIQAIVTRMGANSFQCKGWLIGIFAFVMAMNKESNLFGPWVLILIGPVLLFWYLDGFFLYVEQRYRDLYNFTVKKRTDPAYMAASHTGKELTAKNSFYDLNYSNFEHQELLGKSVLMHFWVSFCSLFNGTKHTPNIVILDKVQTPRTICTVMFSKTLSPFYLMILLFIFTIANSDTLKKWVSIGKDAPKEPITVQLDSMSLRLLKDCPPQILQVDLNTHTQTLPISGTGN